MDYFVYFLECKDNTFYCGYTTNLEKRIMTHNEKKGAKYTKNKTPVKLVYYEKFNNKSKALSREYFLKQLTRKEKEKLIYKLK